MKTSFKNYGIFLIIAIFVGTVLLSNKAGVNLTHHHQLPQLTQKEKIYCKGIFNQVCQIRLTTSINNRENYREVMQLLATAKSGDVIYFYLAGNGGRIDAETQLYNEIQRSKAKIVMVVTGDVYSAHANLSLMGDELQVGDYVLFMFHRSSAYGLVDSYCEAKFKDKKDRTQDAVAKCKQFLNEHLKVDKRIVTEIMSRILNPDEIKRVLAGHDVYLTGEEIKKRLKAKGGFNGRPR